MAIFGIADSIRLLVEPESLTEVRALLRSPQNEDSRICRNQYYFGRDAEAVATDVHRIDSKDECVGIYLVSNPVNPDLANLNQSVWRKPFLTKIKSSSSKETISRRWLFIDCDSNRPSDVSATEFERSKAFELADDAMATLEAFGFREPIKADSGNGCHLLYPVDMPANKASDHLIKEFLSELSGRCISSGAKIDKVTFDVQRMVRVYGTMARKGDSTAERPWRCTGIVSVGDTSPEARKANTESIQKLVEAWREQNAYSSSQDTIKSPLDLAKKYISNIEPAVSGQSGHNKTYRVASILLEGFGLSEPDALAAIREWNQGCQPPWSDNDLVHKISSAAGKIDQSKIGSLIKKQTISESTKTVPADKSDATVADLIRLGQSMQWIWPGWIQRGVLVGIAAEPGAGKTRLCADLARRVYNHMPWPDGTAPTLEKGSKVLWLCCDNQWGEIAQFPDQFGIPADAIYLNGWNDDPTEGTMLDKAEQFKMLEDRIKRIGVSLVFVDTVMNSTSHNTMRPEDGVKYFRPLAEIAQRTNTSIIMVTHLSSGGEALGRRIVGQCRQMINLSRVDGEPANSNNRRLFVSKSNSVIPAELDVRMGNSGNDYVIPGQVQNAPTMDIRWWIGSYLSTGRKLVDLLIRDAINCGYNVIEVQASLNDMAVIAPVNGVQFARLR